MWQDFYGEYKYRKLHINIRTKFSYKIGCNLDYNLTQYLFIESEF